MTSPVAHSRLGRHPRAYHCGTGVCGDVSRRLRVPRAGVPVPVGVECVLVIGRVVGTASIPAVCGGKPGGGPER